MVSHERYVVPGASLSPSRIPCCQYTRPGAGALATRADAYQLLWRAARVYYYVDDDAEARQKRDDCARGDDGHRQRLEMLSIPVLPACSRANYTTQEKARQLLSKETVLCTMEMTTA